MRPRSLALVVCLTAILAACGGGDGDDPGGEEVLLDETSFAQVVAAELRKGDVEATADDREPVVRVERGLNWLEFRPREEFQEYRGDPARREEIVAEVADEALERLEDGIGEVAYAEAEDLLMPLLKPRFALRGLEEKPAQTPFAADLAVVYAVHREDDFTLVTPADVERWGTSLPKIHAVAVANLARQTNEDDPLSCEPQDDEELCGWASEDGYDATRMIVPELRRQIEEIYHGPAMYAVPMEHVFVALSYRVATRDKTEELLRLKVQRDFSMADNPVSPELFVERNGKLVVFEA